jgi:hypothetical protein
MRSALLAVLTAAFLAAIAVPASAEPLTYGCDPPLPRTAANCAIWHTGAVNLRWTIDPNFAPVPGSNCDTTTVTKDTPGTNVTCAVQDASLTLVQKTVTLRVDQTAPSVTGMTPGRPPDQDGWWNHPVALSFTGTDATSQVKSCDTVNYAGPDGEGATVSGSCTDFAGNSASGSFAINYDATPPTIAPGSSDAKVKQISINWTPSADAVSSRVVRTPGIGNAAASEVYSGPDHSFTDSAVTAGRTYTYSINSSDVAGNIASTTMTVTAKEPPPPRLTWRRVKGADYYNVQLFHNGRKILSAWPHFNRLQLQKQWRYGGRRRSLTAGTYRWYVWPGFGRRSQHRYGKLIKTRRFTISAPGKAASRG